MKFLKTENILVKYDTELLRLIKRLKIKHSISNTELNLSIDEQLVYYTDEKLAFDMIRSLITLNQNLCIAVLNNIMTVQNKFFTKLIIPDEITLSNYNDFDQGSLNQFRDYLNSINFKFEIDNNIFKFLEQKVSLEFKNINEIYKHILYGTNCHYDINLISCNKYYISKGEKIES